ncbi:CCCH RNA binding domain-containing protein [Cryptosporidium canis]|uniref:CCCH RNA binding domain-containing protein n=1 Tax=Cryptosporidium canis TaxID=195482 RepID=A0ABQ8P4B3_9CRYT|nr:CCCH RNA binding domain-containing protein [Cryptosporidium canis]KAJ1610853.1 CCCH RNA binding domain-containing protein [Cryptosporidium canis]
MANALLSVEELTRFRTKLCRRSLKDGCDFGPLRCQYSHNVYWPRRCPFYLSDRTALRYLPDICPDITILDHVTGKVANFCNRGGYCPYSHSMEEVIYHPLVYKSELCQAFQKGECKAYYCHLIHGLAERRQERSYTLPFTRGINLNKYPNVKLVDKTSSESESSKKYLLPHRNESSESACLGINTSNNRASETIKVNSLELLRVADTTNFLIQPQLENKSTVGKDIQINKMDVSWQEPMDLSRFCSDSDVDPGIEIKNLLNKWRKVAEHPELYISEINLSRIDYWQYISGYAQEISSIINSLGQVYCSKVVYRRDNSNNLGSGRIYDTELRECIDFSLFTQINSDTF